MPQVLATAFNGSSYITAPIGSPYNWPANTSQGMMSTWIDTTGGLPTAPQKVVDIQDASGNDIFIIALVPNPTNQGGVVPYLYINPDPESPNPSTLSCYFVNSILDGDSNYHHFVVAWDTTGGTPGITAALDGTPCVLPPLNPDPTANPVYYSYGTYNPAGSFGLGGAYNGQASANAPLSGHIPYQGGGNIYPEMSNFQQQSLTWPESVWNGDGSMTLPATYTVSSADAGHLTAPVGAVGTLASYSGYAECALSLAAGDTAQLDYVVAGHDYSVSNGNGTLQIQTGTVPVTSGSVTADNPTYVITGGGLPQGTSITAPLGVGISGTYNYPGFWDTTPLNLSLTSGKVNVGGTGNSDNYVGWLTETLLFFTPFDYVGIGISTIVSLFRFPDGSARPIGGSGYGALMNPGVAGGTAMISPQVYVTGGPNYFPFCQCQQKPATLGVSATMANYFTVVGSLGFATSDPFDYGVDV